MTRARIRRHENCLEINALACPRNVVAVAGKGARSNSMVRSGAKPLLLFGTRRRPGINAFPTRHILV
jgi:hypothetical protein